jgi:uncharacterized protein
MTIGKVQYTWNQFDKDTARLALKILRSGWQPDYIIGLVRGGAVVGVALSHLMDCLMYSGDVRLRDKYKLYAGPEHNAWVNEDACAGKKILIVDDINDSGATFEWVKKHWDLEGKETVKYAALFDNEGSSFGKVDYSVNTLYPDTKPWIVFPWEI